jgi:hypothetical protein
MKIFDCSNSSERPMNRHFGGFVAAPINLRKTRQI